MNTNNPNPAKAAARFREILGLLSLSLPEVREILAGDEIETTLKHQAEIGRETLSLPTLHPDLGHSSIQTAGCRMILLILSDKHFNEVSLRLPTERGISDDDFRRIRTAAIALDGFLAIDRKREA